MDVKTDIARQADDIRRNLDDLDGLIDELSESKAESLRQVYESINIILRAQKVLVSNPLRLVRDKH